MEEDWFSIGTLFSEMNEEIYLGSELLVKGASINLLTDQFTVMNKKINI